MSLAHSHRRTGNEVQKIEGDAFAERRPDRANCALGDRRKIENIAYIDRLAGYGRQGRLKSKLRDGGISVESVARQHFDGGVQNVADRYRRTEEVAIGIGARVEPDFRCKCIEKFQCIDICRGEGIVVDEREVDGRAEKAAQDLVREPLVERSKAGSCRERNIFGISRDGFRFDLRAVAEPEKTRKIGGRLRCLRYADRVEVRCVHHFAVTRCLSFREEPGVRCEGRIGNVVERRRGDILGGIVVESEDRFGGGARRIGVGYLSHRTERCRVRCRLLIAMGGIHGAGVDDDHGDCQCEHQRADGHHRYDAILIARKASQKGCQ